MTPAPLTDAQLNDLLAWLAEIVETCGEVYMPLFERAVEEHERRQALKTRLAAFRRTGPADQPETAKQFS